MRRYKFLCKFISVFLSVNLIMGLYAAPVAAEETDQSDNTEEMSDVSSEEDTIVVVESSDAGEITEITAESDPGSDVPSDQTEVSESFAEEPLCMPSFMESSYVNGVIVTVTAAEGVFPGGSYLCVTEVPQDIEDQVTDSIESTDGHNDNVAVSYTFDIKVFDQDGNELQPADGQSVNVSFEMAEVSDTNLDTSVYHIEGEGAALTPVLLDSYESGDAVIATSDGFSYYTVEFTYGDLQYVMQGDTTIPLTDILDLVGLTGSVGNVVVSNESLFSASCDNGIWSVTAHQAFTSEEWMRVTIDGIEYEIVVTDAINISYGAAYRIDGSTTYEIYIPAASPRSSSGNCVYDQVSNNETVPPGVLSLASNFTATISADGKLDLKGNIFNLGNGYNAWKVGKTSEGEYYFYRANVSIDPTYTAPTARSLTFNNSSQSLVNAGSVTAGGTLEYAVGDSNTSAPSSGWSTSVPSRTNADTYYVWWRINAASGYNAVAASCLTSTISQATNSWTTSAAKRNNWTFNNTNYSLFSTVPVPQYGTVEYSVNSGTYSANVPSATNAGTYTVSYRVTGNNNYTGLSGSFTVTVSKADNPLSYSNQIWNITFSASAQTKTLNAASNGQGTVTYSLQSQTGGSYFTFNTSTRVLTAAANTPSGTYTVVVRASAAGNNNYNGKTADSTITVTVSAASMSVTANGYSGTYDGQAHSISLSGVPSGATVRYGITSGNYDLTANPSYVNAGTHTVYYQVTKPNHATVTGSATVTITAKEIGLTWGNSSFTYDGTTHVPTATATNLIAGDTCTVTVTGGQMNAGFYTATASSLSNTNYKLPSGKTHAFTIDKVSIEITANSISCAYTGSAVTDTGYRITSGSLVTGDVITDVTVTGSRTAVGSGDNIPSGAVIKRGDTDVTANYDISYVNGTITVTQPDGNTVTVSITGWTYGDTPNSPVSTSQFGTPIYTYSDAVDGTYTSDVPATVGTWYVRAYVAATDDYPEGSATQSFTISSRAIEITAGSDSKIYDGTSLTCGTYSITSGTLASGDTLSSVSVSGSQTACGSSDNTPSGAVIRNGNTVVTSNYSITYVNGTLSVSQRTLTVTAVPVTKTYGDTDPELTYTYEGLLDGDTITGSLARTPGESVGTYSIGQGSIAVNDNYAIMCVPADFTITARPATLTVDQLDKVYGESDPVLTATATGLAGSDSLDYTISRTAGENVGTYDVTITLGSNPNYDVGVTNGTFTINIKPAPDVSEIQIPVANSPVYDGHPHPLIDASGQLPEGYTAALYSIDGVNWSDTVPEVMAAGDYSVIVRYVGDNNHETFDLDVIEVNVAKKPAPELGSAQIPSGISDLCYDGHPQVIVNAPSSLPDGYTGIEYSLDGTTWDITVPEVTDAGDYTVRVRYVGDNNHETFDGEDIEVTVAKKPVPGLADSQIPVGINNLSYTGEPQELIAAPSQLPDGYTDIEYSVDGINWSSDIPVGIDAGDHTVEVRYLGDGNHEDIRGEDIVVTIGVSEAPSEVDEPEMPSNNDFTSGLDPQPLIEAPERLPEGYDGVLYSLDGIEWTEEIPTATEPGVYNVHVRYRGDGNHEDFDGETITVTVSAADYVIGNVVQDEEVSEVVIDIHRSDDDARCIRYFTRLEMDGVELVRDSQYTATTGSTIVTFSEDYLRTLTPGEHTVTVYFRDGSVTTTIVVPEFNPRERAVAETVSNHAAPNNAAAGAVAATGEAPGKTSGAGIILVIASGLILGGALEERKKFKKR